MISTVTITEKHLEYFLLKDYFCNVFVLPPKLIARLS